MFTGIINGCGTIRAVDSRSNETRFTVEHLFSLSSITKGESISINGVCLTVEETIGNIFIVYASPTTLQRTNLNILKYGSVVNLERALSIGDRLGGHIVTGHVDCVATVKTITKQGEAHHIRVGYPSQFNNEVVPKGSIALDGISLTIVDCESEYLDVTIIPTTWEITTISHWKIGTQINMETDIIGKYVYKMVTPILSSKKNSPCTNNTLTLKFLHEKGFF